MSRIIWILVGVAALAVLVLMFTVPQGQPWLSVTGSSPSQGTR